MLLTNQGSRFLRRRAAAPSDWWTVPGKTCIVAYKSIGQVDLATSYVNLANPGVNNAIPSVAPTLVGAGWQSNGHIDTGIIATATTSILLRLASVAGTGYICGAYTAGARIEIRPNLSGSMCFYSHGNSTVSKGPSALSGVLAITADGGYRDGVLDIAGTGGWSAVASTSILLFGRSGIYDYCPGVISSVAIYADTLSAAEVAEKSLAMAALA